MNIITRKEAKAQGLSRYFTGKPCKNGHIAECWTNNYNCMGCADQRKKENPELHRKSNKKYYSNHKNYYRECVRKSRAKRFGYKPPMPATRPMPEFCEIGCGRKATCLDHDHETGKFRGWLCSPCNRSIGLLGDTREAIQQTLLYFDREIYENQIDTR